MAFRCFQLPLPPCSRRAKNAASSFPFPLPASSAALARKQAGNAEPCPSDREEQLGGDGSVAPGIGLPAGMMLGRVRESLCFLSLYSRLHSVFHIKLFCSCFPDAQVKYGELLTHGFGFLPTSTERLVTAEDCSMEQPVGQRGDEAE